MATKEENARSKIKPTPSLDEMIEEIKKTSSSLGPNNEPTPRQKLYHCMISSMKIQRCFNHTIILLFGASGVGKSSTINHLLDTGDGMPVAKTSNSDSKTKMTCEYMLTVDDPDYEVCDLTLGAVDTPGSSDVRGTAQDACNLYSVDRFFETHPQNPLYPNLIFLIVSAMDQRLEGPESNLAKALKSLKKLELVDVDYPNLVAVLTFCCSIGHKNVSKWEARMKEKMDMISCLIFETLDVQAPVVLLENDYDDLNELEVDGDFTVLPNGERQPKNLYNACRKLLERNGDHFGLLTFNACFTKAKKKCPTDGHKVEANLASEGLCEEEKQLLLATEDAITKNAKKANPPDSDGLVGQGYNIITDKTVASQIMKFQTVVDDQFGFPRPASAKVVTVNETREFQEEFKDEKSYVVSRLHNLHVSIDVAPRILKMAPRAGFNASWEGSGTGECSKSGYSHLTEHRKLRVTIANFKEQGISFTPDFECAVEKLPDNYSIHEGSQKEFNRFFNRFGHFVVTSAYAGGSVEIKTTGRFQESSEETGLTVTGSANAKLASAGGELCGQGNTTSSNNLKESQYITAVLWCGGNSDLHDRDTLHSKKDASVEIVFIGETYHAH